MRPIVTSEEASDRYAFAYVSLPLLKWTAFPVLTQKLYVFVETRVLIQPANSYRKIFNLGLVECCLKIGGTSRRTALGVS